MQPDLSFAHLSSLTTSLGLYEHALLTEPREEHGMCVDDVARGLVVTSRVASPDAEVTSMARTYLDFLLAAQHDDGLMHNRRNLDATWGDAATADDHWGRALWAFGTAVRHSPDPVVVAGAREGAVRAMRARSRHARASAYAALGASLLLDESPGDKDALRVLVQARSVLRRSRMDRSWPWPEDVLTYANAVLPEAALVIGRHLDAPDLRDDGRYLLRWLIDQQTVDEHLSMIPTGGRRRGQPISVGFDQQPIEVASLAEACRTAYLETGDERWLAVIDRCLAWFAGDNDAGLPMHDVTTGGAYDGLEAGSVNQNQGAESTLAWLATQQVAALSRLETAR